MELLYAQTVEEVEILPPFLRVPSQASDFIPNVWTQYLQLGKLSQPENDGDRYWVNYTALDNPSGGEITIISTMQKNKPHRVGYSIIDLSTGTHPNHNQDNIE